MTESVALLACAFTHAITQGGNPFELNFWRNASGTDFIGLYMQMVDIAKMYDRQWSEEAPSRFAAAPPTYDLADRMAELYHQHGGWATQTAGALVLWAIQWNKENTP